MGSFLDGAPITKDCAEAVKYIADCADPEMLAVEARVCARIEKDKIKLEKLVGELLDMLETVEVSDGCREFHPTTIGSCRSQHVHRLSEIMPKIKAIVRPGSK